MASSGNPYRVQQILSDRLPDEIRAARDFERWFEPLKLRVTVAVQTAHDAVMKALEAERELVCEHEGGSRTIWSVTGTDGKSLMKSVASVRTKLGRELCEREAKERLPPGRMSIDQIEKILLDFGDLGRFRIVCDLSLDVEKALRVLIPKPRKTLLGRFPLRGKIKDFTYDFELRRLARGHRAKQFTVKVEEDGQVILVEIQIMTLLQNAWDRRNHPIYEWEREGGSLPARLRVNDVALAEALHLVDEQATRNWREFLRIRKRSG